MFLCPQDSRTHLWQSCFVLEGHLARQGHLEVKQGRAEAEVGKVKAARSQGKFLTTLKESRLEPTAVKKFSL